MLVEHDSLEPGTSRNQNEGRQSEGTREVLAEEPAELEGILGALLSALGTLVIVALAVVSLAVRLVMNS